MRIGFPTAVFVLVLVAAGSAHGRNRRPDPPDIQVSVDRNTVVQGQPFEIEIRVTAESSEEPQIQVPEFKGLKVLQRFKSKPSSGMSFSFSFGTGQQAQRITRTSGTTVFTFVVLASEPGTIQIPGVKVVLDGHRFEGRPRSIEVLPSSAPTTVSPDATDQVLQSGSGADQVLENVKLDPNYFVHMSPSKTECQLGELIVLDVYLYTTQMGLHGYQFVREPGTEGFWVETFEDVPRNRLQSERVVIEGTVYERVHLKKLALFPIKDGSLTIAPAIFSFNVGGGFFSMGREVKRAAEPVTIKVSPLPEKNRPVDFDTSNVGEFHFTADVDNREVKVGEPVTLTLTVKGEGNIRNAVIPEFSELEGFRVYEPESESEVLARGNTVTGENTRRILMIPKTQGTYTIDPLSFRSFSIRKNAYVEDKSRPITIVVAPGDSKQVGGVSAEPSASRSNAAPLVRMNNQLRSITSRINVSTGSSHVVGTVAFWVLVIIPPGLFFVLVLVAHTRRRMAEAHYRGRARRADAIAVRHLGELEKNSRQIGNEEFYARLQKILVGFLEERLSSPVAGDTMSELALRLKDRGVPDDLTGRTIAMLESYEFARFARSEEGSLGMQGDLDATLALIRDLARVTVTSVKEAAQ